MIFFLCKRFKVLLPETLRHIFGNFGGPCCLSRGKTTDTQHDSALEAEVNANDNMYWNYRETFARPTVIQQARRSLHKSLTGLRRVNPLGLNPVQARTTWTGNPSRRSFSSIFQRRSVVSTHPSVSQVSLFPDLSGTASVPPSPPPLPPLYTAFPSARPSSIPGQWTGLIQDDTKGSFAPMKAPPAVFKPTENRRISQVTPTSLQRVPAA